MQHLNKAVKVTLYISMLISLIIQYQTSSFRMFHELYYKAVKTRGTPTL